MLSESPRILLIDDDVVFGKIMGEVAQTQGISLEYHPTVRKLTELLSKSRFDVILIDYELRGVTGLQLVRLISKHHPSAKVVLISSYLGIDGREWPQTVRDFVCKRSGPDTVLSRAREALNAP